MNAIIALIGTALIHLGRYSSKKKAISSKIWLQNNTDEIAYALLCTIVLYIICMTSGSMEWMHNLLPKILKSMPIEMFEKLVYLSIGLGGATIIRFIKGFIPAIINKIKNLINNKTKKND